MLSIRPSGYCISEAVRGMRPSSWARGSGTWTKPVNPVSMTASTDVDGPDGAEMAIVTTGLRLLSSDPRIVAIRQATRPERRSIADTHEVEGTSLRGGLLVRCLRRLGQENLFSFDIDKDIAAAMAAFEFGTMSLVDFAADAGNFSRVETHHVPQ